MKKTSRILIAAVILVGTLGLGDAYATNASKATYKQPIEVTGCLQQGPVAKEYLIQDSAGKTWGVNEGDMYINHYVGHTVTVVGDAVRPTADERVEGGAQQYLIARDLAVENKSCRK